MPIVLTLANIHWKLDFVPRSSISRRERQIIFPMYTAAKDQVDLHTVRLDGSHLTRITNTPEPENFADWKS